MPRRCRCVGYLIGSADLVARLDAARQPWSTSTPALVAIERLAAADDERRLRARRVAEDRAVLLDALWDVGGVTAWHSDANFLLVRTDHPDLRGALLERGFAARRGDTFPGLDTRYLRLAVRDVETSHRLVAAIRTILGHVHAR